MTPRKRERGNRNRKREKYQSVINNDFDSNLKNTLKEYSISQLNSEILHEVYFLRVQVELIIHCPPW